MMYYFYSYFQSINKMVLKEGIKSIMFTCSSDGYIKLWSISDNFQQIQEKKFEGVKIL